MSENNHGFFGFGSFYRSRYICLKILNYKKLSSEKLLYLLKFVIRSVDHTVA